MKLRFFSVALLQAMGFYATTEAVFLRPSEMSEADSSAMTEAEAEINNEGEQFLHGCIQRALEAKIVDGLSKCHDLKDCSNFDFFDGASTLEFGDGDFTLEGLCSSCFEHPMEFEINMDVPLNIDLGPPAAPAAPAAAE